MLQRLGRAILLLTALGILYSGPVAACVCADEPAAPMPCCPDDAQPSGQANHNPLSDIDVACDPLAAEVVLPSSPDFPQPVALSNEVPSWLTSDPPAPAQPAEPPPYHAPPIYLTTLRLRN
jgi:hypothetical protein